jgi:hypothetical protein
MYLFANLRQSRELMRSCYAVLRGNRELLLFPALLSGIVFLLMAVFAVIVLTSGAAGISGLCYSGAAFLLLYFIGCEAVVYCHVALAGAVLSELEGIQPTFFEGLYIARQRKRVISRYALFAALMNVLHLFLALIRSPRSGMDVAEVHDLRRGTATFLMFPVLAAGKGGVNASIEESAALVKNTWGEKVFAHSGLGQFFFALSFVVLPLLAALLYLTY